MNAVFFENFDIWRNAVAVLMISGAALSFAGVWISLRKSVFLPLVVSSFSSLGVVVSFLLADLSGITLSPYLFSLIFAIAISFYFANPRYGALKGQVAVYLISSALIFIAGNFIRADLHDIDSILFGTAVLADTEDIIFVSAGAVILFAVFAIFYPKFLFVSFDPESAPAFGINTKLYDTISYALFAIMISVASRAAGAFPVFGLTILPALTGLNLGKSMKTVFIISIAAAVISAFAGYYASFVLEIPTGASVVAVAGIIYLAARNRKG